MREYSSVFQVEIVDMTRLEVGYRARLLIGGPYVEGIRAYERLRTVHT